MCVVFLRPVLFFLFFFLSPLRNHPIKKQNTRALFLSFFFLCDSKKKKKQFIKNFFFFFLQSFSFSLSAHPKDTRPSSMAR